MLVYRCGPDMFWGKSMDDIFSLELRKTAPPWLRKGLEDLPLERRFHADGTSRADSDTHEQPDVGPPEIEQG